MARGGPVIESCPLRPRQVSVVVLVALLVLLKPDPSAGAGTTSWTNGGLGEWSIASNWNNGEPDETSFAYIANGVTALLTTGGTARELHIGGAAGNSTLLMTESGGHTGVLTKIINTYVGDAAGQTGSLTMDHGAAFYGGQNSFLIAGSNPLTHGTVSVSGTNSLVLMTNVVIADQGTASLTLSDGAGILCNNAGLGISPGSSGSATVTGTGSLWSSLTGIINVGGQGGFNGGSASLNVTDGGVVAFGALKVFSGGLVSVNNGSIATAGLVIASSDSAPLAGGTLGDLIIGDTTAGRMLVKETGRVVTRRGFIGGSLGSAGSVTVTGPDSRWDCAGSVWAGNLGTGTLAITNGGVLTSTGNGYLGFDTNSSGSALVSDAGSTWTMAVNLYVGGNGLAPGGPGILQIENGGVVGAAATTVYNTGTLRLGVNHTLNGPLTFLGGFIQATASNTISKSFSIGNGGVFVQTAGFDLTLGGNISGTGGLTKFGPGGSGTLKLTGSNTYTGATAINAGTLQVDGSITSAASVNNGGRLSGSGSVGTVTVNSGGTVVPGSTAGKLSFNGNYTQVSGSVLEIELGGYTPGSGYDQLAVSGHAAIAGTLKVTLINKFRPSVGDSFTILTSNSESGNFTSIITCGFTVQSVTSPAGISLLVTAVDPPPLVLNTNDSGPGSLRSVIAGACPNSIITFAPDVRGAITLTSGELPITKNLTINGPGANLLSVQRGAAAGNFRIFNIGPASVAVMITGLTIADGKVPNGSGGGIANVGTLTLGGVTLSGNTAQDGGGIFNNFGIVTISHSTLSGNSVSSASIAGSGGAMFNSGGVVMIDHSTISGNTAIGPGGNSDSGGGIITNVGSVTLTNSTVTGNSGDIGGGIRNINGGTLRAMSTLIALNTSASGPDVNGPITSDGFNLIGNAAGAVVTPALSSDQAGVTPAALNLGPLQDNGGPTKTHALLSNSVAIDKGHSNGSFADQRGLVQPLDLPGSNATGGDGADVGAFEYGSVAIQPALQISRMEGGSVWLAVAGAPFTVYPLKFAPNLGLAWTGVGDVTVDALGMGDFQHTPSDDPAPGVLRGFYRIEY